jgi:hypothetical protein
MIIHALLVSMSSAAVGAPSLPYRLPATLESGRFYVTPATPDGAKVHLFTDTGGGFFLGESSARILGIEFDAAKLAAPPSDDAEPQLAPWPTWSEQAWIPAPQGRPELIPVVRVPPRRGALDLSAGMLGGPWFANRCWEFDYSAGTLRLLPDGALPEVPAEQRVQFGFQKDAAGAHTAHFARLRVGIDGAPFDLLFDTGATTELTEAALATIGDQQPAVRATGFIVASVAERWHKAHPDWRYLDGAENGTGAAMVQVPSVEMAGFTTGPVWFTVRADANFHGYMSQWMDQKIDGALGGNAFAGFRITVDYLSEAATFERPE